MKLKVIGPKRGPHSRVLFFKGRGYRPGEIAILTEADSKEFLEMAGASWNIEEVKEAPEAQNKMLKTEKTKDGTASKRPGNVESGQGVSLDFLE